MADIIADVGNIQDEDQLRRMWSQTEDFAKKKEIRVRLYKLRESRLKSFYNEDTSSNNTIRNTSSSNIMQESARKHSVTKTHTDSIQDQGYMSMKSKEIRDSESPTRDIHGKIIRNDSYNNKSSYTDIKLRDNNTVQLPNSQDWTTNQSSNYLTKTEGNTVTESAERQSEAVLSKNNENINLKAYENQEFSSTDNSKNGNIDKSNALAEKAELVQHSSYKDDNTSFEGVSKKNQNSFVSSSVKQTGNTTSYSKSTKTVSSSSSSSKTVTSSSKVISGNNLAIDSGDDISRNKTYSIQQTDNDLDDEYSGFNKYSSSSNLRNKSTRASSRALENRSSSSNLRTTQHIDESTNHDNANTTSDVNTYVVDDNVDISNIRSSKLIEQRSDSSSSIKSSRINNTRKDSTNSIRSSTNVSNRNDTTEIDQSNNTTDRKSTTDVDQSESFDTSRKNDTRKSSTTGKYDRTKNFISDAKTTDTIKVDVVENNLKARKDSVDTDVKVYNSRKDIKTSHLTDINTSATTDQKIMTEINNLDSYLSTHPTSTPVSPRSVATDGDYQDGRRTPVKHPSTLDLPKECTDGQYLTTYNDAYRNRISTDYDISPTHNAFASSLRADTPERSPVSPNRAFSSDRKSPRSSPEKYNTRSVSENRYRKSPEKTPTRDSPSRYSNPNNERNVTRGSPDRYTSRKSSPEKAYTRQSPQRTPTRDSYSKISPERTPTREMPYTSNRVSPTRNVHNNRAAVKPSSPTRQSPDRVYNRLDKDTDATRKVQERRLSSSSYTVDTKKKVDTNKSKRKFSTAQSKDAAKKRVSTPKVSPDTSPTRDDSSDSSDNSQGTYNKDSRKTQDVTRNDSHDTYNRSDNISTDYKRSDSKDTFNKYRRDSTDTYNKEDITRRNDSQNSYTVDYEETDTTSRIERTDSSDSFNVSKLRKDSKDITKQDLKQRKLLNESDSYERNDAFIKTEVSVTIKENEYKSPSVSPVRQKSPVYKSEGSFIKDAKQTIDKNLVLVEENINIDVTESNQTSPSVTPCTSPDAYQTLPRRPSILKKKKTEFNTTYDETTVTESRKSPEKSPDRSRRTSPEKSTTNIKESTHNTIARKSSILKSTSKTAKNDTLERRTSILKSPVKEKERSPEKSLERKTSSSSRKDSVTQARKSSVRDQVSPSRKSPSPVRKSPTRTRKSASPDNSTARKSPTRSRKSPSPVNKSPVRQSPTRSTLPVESRLTSPTQASLIRTQVTSEYYEHTTKDRSGTVRSPSREKDAPALVQSSPRTSPIRDHRSPDKTRKSPVRDRKSPQKSSPGDIRPTRKSSIPRTESLKTINKKSTSTVSTVRSSTPKTVTKVLSSSRIQANQIKSPSKPVEPKTPITSRSSTVNLKKNITSTLVKTNSYTNRRSTEPVKQRPSTPTKIPTKSVSKSSPQIVKSAKKLPVKSPKSSKELNISKGKKQTKTKIDIDEELRASNKVLENILSQEQKDYDSELDDEQPPAEFLVDDDDDYYETTTVTTQKSSTTNKQNFNEEYSDEEENENIKITKSKQVEETRANKQNEDLLSVIVQLPNSSRESTPGVRPNAPQSVPYTLDINQPTRYADYYSEPETDNENRSIKTENNRYDQVTTDLDEETIDINVSVADRVNKFLKSTKEDAESQKKTNTVVEKKSVSQAKNIFESIAKSQSSPTYNENITKTQSTPLSSRKPVEEKVVESKNYYELSEEHEERRIANDFINMERENIDINEHQETLSKKSPKDLYLEKTQHSTPVQKTPKSQPQKKVFDDTYYIEKNKKKLEDKVTDLSKTTINSCDEYIDIKEEINIPKKSPKDIYLEKAQKTNSKTNVLVERKKSVDDVKKEKQPEEKPYVRGSSTLFNTLKSKKSFFEERINTETEKAQSFKKTKSSDKMKSDRKSPSRQSPVKKVSSRPSSDNITKNKYDTRRDFSSIRISPVGESPYRKSKSPSRQSPARKSPEKIAKRKYDRKDTLEEIRSKNIIAERRSKFSPSKGDNVKKEHVKNIFKSTKSKENVKPIDTVDKNERSSEVRSYERATVCSVLHENRDSVIKDRKPSVENIHRRPSTDNKFEERRASFENKIQNERRLSSENKYNERRISSDIKTHERRTSADKTIIKESSQERKLKNQRASPEKRKSPKKTTVTNERQDSFNNKFGVTLKKRNSGNTEVTSTKTSSSVLKSTNNTQGTDSIFDIESIFDLELLEKMLEKAVGYDQRRRLRAQIREVRNKTIETSQRKSSTSQSPSRNTNQKKSYIEEKQKESKYSTLKTTNTLNKAPNQLKSTNKFNQENNTVTKKTNYDEKRTPISSSPTSQLEKKNSYNRTDTSESVTTRKSSTEITTSSSYTSSQVRSREENCTDSITSSYGVGPTDDNGRPLFGLRALKRANTNKTLIDDDTDNTTSVQIEEQEEEESSEIIKDSSGRPLFGGLRALKTQNYDMPEQPVGSQFRNLVEKHESNALSDNVTSSTHSTVVSSRTTMKTDNTGKVSVAKDVMQGELSIKNNEEPKGKIIKQEYKFNKLNKEDEGKSETKTTTAILNSKNLNNSKITENYKIQDHNKYIENSKRNGTTKQIENNNETINNKKNKNLNNSFILNEKRNNYSSTKSDSNSSFTTSSKQIIENEKRNSYKKADSKQNFDDNVSEDDDEDNENIKRKPVVRGDSVRALQNKFQQATVSSSKKQIISSPGINQENKSVTTTTSKASRSVNSTAPSSVTTSSKSTVTSSSSTRTQTFSTVTKRSSTMEEEADDFDENSGFSVVEDDGFGNSSAALVSRIEKQRVASSVTGVEDRQNLDITDIDTICDENQLRLLLESCSDYESRRQIRARLREVMADNNDSTPIISNYSNNYDDVGDEDEEIAFTESNKKSSENNQIGIATIEEEETNTINNTNNDNNKNNNNKESLTEVQSTLARLENELIKSDNNNKESVQELINKLKLYLNVENGNNNNNNNNNDISEVAPQPPPRKYQPNKNKNNRHTIAFNESEASDVRAYLDQCSNEKQTDHIDQYSVNAKVNAVDNNLINNKLNQSKQNVMGSYQTHVGDPNYVAVNRPNNNVGNVKSNILQQQSVDSTRSETGFKPLKKQNSLDSCNNEIVYYEQYAPVSYDNQMLGATYDEHNTSYYNTNVNQTNSNTNRIDPNDNVTKPLVGKLTLRENNSYSNDDAEDGDISSDDEENTSNIKSARKLMKFAKNEMKSKQLVRSNKKIKMKRSNTIDIPKNLKYYSSGDELLNEDRNKSKTPTFIPKTENDFKFLAFLKKNNNEDTKCYNASARGGAHWNNRFSSIKTTFENAERQIEPVQDTKKSNAKLFWQKSEERNNPKQLPWMVSEDSNNVITGSLTVQTKPKQIFTHAIKSPFQAINKIQPITQTKTSHTGTVKQIANEKFNKQDDLSVKSIPITPTKHVNSKVSNIENGWLNNTRQEPPNPYSSSFANSHRNFAPEQSNFKPIAQRFQSPTQQNHKPIVQTVYPYQPPQPTSSYQNQHSSHLIRKQFPEPQYQKPTAKVISPQYAINYKKEQNLYHPPQNFHGTNSSQSSNVSNYPDSVRSISSTREEYYEPPFEPDVIEIHKTPLCTQTTSHFTPISPATPDGGNISYEPQTVAVSRVMGKEQCQQAVIVNNKTNRQLNESTNILKNIISQHQNNGYDNHSTIDDESLQGVNMRLTNQNVTLPSNTSYIYPTQSNRSNLSVQSMNSSSNSPMSPSQYYGSTSSQNYPASYVTSNHTSTVQAQNTFNNSNQNNYPRSPQINHQSMPQTQEFPQHGVRGRPSSMYQPDEFNPSVNFSQNPIYSPNSSDSPYMLSSSKSSSSIYPSNSNSTMSPLNYPYHDMNRSKVQNTSKQSEPTTQFSDFSNQHVPYRNSRESSVPPISRAPYNTSSKTVSAANNSQVTKSKTPSDNKIAYMNYISQISPQTMQNKLNSNNSDRKSVSPLYNTNSYGELSQSSTQSSISENSPINKLNSPHTNLSTPSSPQLPAPPPILTKTPQLKISSKTAFVPVKPFSQIIPKQIIIPKQQHHPISIPSNQQINFSPSVGFLSPPTSPINMPSVLQKSESWHQMVLEKMAPKKLSPIPHKSSKLLPKAKSSHSLHFPKQYEAGISDTIAKQKTVQEYLSKNNIESKKEINKYNFKQFKKTKSSKIKNNTPVALGDNLENVDEAFDSLFNDSK